MMDGPGPRGSCRFPEVRLPRRVDGEARAALLGADGGESYLAAQDRRFCLLNHTEAAGQIASDARNEAAKLERELGAVERKLAWTPSTVARRSSKAPRERGSITIALLLSAIAALGAIVSVTVLSEYALRSASDLFAQNNTVAAVLFATLPSLAAVSLKAFEQRLVSPDARWVYAIALFSIGMVSFCVWLVATAVSLAPELGGPTILLNEGSGGPLISRVLLLSTISCETSLGFTILSGVGQLLAPNHGYEAISNPTFHALTKEKVVLSRAIAECHQRRAEADDYLGRAAAGRELTQREAENDLTRATELFTQIQVVALGLATAFFLKNPE